MYTIRKLTRIEPVRVSSTISGKPRSKMRQDTLAMLYAAAILAIVGVAVLIALAVLLVCCEWLGQPATQQKSPSKKTSKGPQSGKTQVAESKSERTTKPSKFPAELHKFMQDVIGKLLADHDEVAAILFLLPDRDISENVKLDSSSELTKDDDSESSTFPPDAELLNYIAAGSQGPDHAETILLGKLDILMERFGEDKCKTIVLYTRSLPCDSRKDPSQKSCKAAIIEKLGPLTKTKRVILVYTSKIKEEDPISGGKPVVSPKKEKEVIKDLTKAGIEVGDITY